MSVSVLRLFANKRKVFPLFLKIYFLVNFDDHLKEFDSYSLTIITFLEPFPSNTCNSFCIVNLYVMEFYDEKIILSVILN